MRTCGADNACLGVIGAAQVDQHGNINSTRLANGRLLVGSGGANDIASAAAEVVVLATCDRSRLLLGVDYITSAGRGVLRVVTDLCTFRRDAATDATWSIADVCAVQGAPRDEVVERIRANCAWDNLTAGDVGFMQPILPDELHMLRALDTPGLYR
jgi:acyl CoA:acetate/3-ketoacid CoA transferase beta subunit